MPLPLKRSLRPDTIPRRTCHGTVWHVVVGFLVLAAIPCAVAVAALAKWEGSEVVLDLTIPTVEQPERERTWGCAGGSLLGTSRGVVLPRELALQLHIRSLNGSTYREGDELTCDLLLTNEGSKPILLPWTVDAGLVFNSKCGWLPGADVVGLHGNVSLVLDDEHGHKQFLGGHDLFGISSDPTTYRTLAAGRSVVIKTGGKVTLHYVAGMEKAVSLKQPVEFTATAIFTLDDSPAFGAYRPVLSTNEYRVTVKPQ